MVKKKRLSIFDPENVVENQSVAVLGLGRFGESLALELMATGADVLGVDIDPKIVQRFNNKLTHVVAADITQPEVLDQLNILEFDKVVVAVGSHLESSILVTSYLLRQGASNIWAKAVSDHHGLILEQLGINHIVFPEKDMGQRVAHVLQSGLKEYIQIDRDYVMVMALAPEIFVGKPLSVQEILTRFGIAVTSYKDSETGAWAHIADTVTLGEDDTILFTGDPQTIEKFTRKFL